MALPNMMTAHVLGWYSQNPLYQVADGLLEVTKLLALQKGLTMSAPAVARGITMVQRLGAGGLALGRSGIALGQSAVAEVTYAVETFGYTTRAAAYLSDAAYLFFLQNSVPIIVGTVTGNAKCVAAVSRRMLSGPCVI
jgi:hypothetical protein